MASILVVNDREANRDSLVTLLGSIGHRVLTATDGGVALQVARAEHPDLIMADIVMPAMDGYELARQIRADPTIVQPRIVFLTPSYVVEEARRLAEACGVAHVISRPSEPGVILQIVQDALEAAPVPPPASVPQTFHREQIRVLTDKLAKKVEELEAEIGDRKRAQTALAASEQRVAEDTTERQKTKEAVAVSEAELRSLFAAMTDVVVVLDGQGRYLQIAPTNPGLLVRPPAELLGRTVQEVMPADDSAMILENIRLALADRRPVHVEYALDIGANRVWFAATVSPFGEDRVVWIARDITARKQRERELEAIAAVSSALRKANTKTEMIPILLDQVMDLLGAGAASLALRDPETKELVIDLGRGEMAGLAGARVPYGEGIGGHVVATGQPYVTDDAGADPRMLRADWILRAKAVACVPLISQEHALGVLWAGRNAPFIESEVRLLGAIADMAANAIRRAALLEETESRLQRLAALREIDSAIMNSLDLRLTLGILLGQVTKILGADAADILVRQRGMNTLEFAAGHGFRGSGIERSRVRVGEGVAGRVALERKLAVVAHLPSSTDFQRAPLLRPEDFVALVVAPLVSKGKVLGVLEIFHRATLNPTSDWLGFLETLADQAAIAISDAWTFEDLQSSNMEMVVAYDTTLEGWSAALDLRDKETEGHSQRVTTNAVELARELGVSEADQVHIRRGALLHDIGKMGVPDGILLKPAELTEEEWVVMRRHPSYAFELLSPIAFLRPALDIPHAHHEKWDGSGYPRGLKGEEIPLAARIFAVVDVWDALTSDRPYRKAWSPQKAREYIREQSGVQFDPRVVEAFLRMDVSKAR